MLSWVNVPCQAGASNVPTKSPGKDRPPSPRNILQAESFTVGAANFATGKSAHEQIKRFCTYSIRRAYALDNGVPYPKNSDPNILLVDSHPRS
ncbi:MAG TPA: hypothetical protein VE860_26430, partial [Chthoniobacterales bacterium]|nr:hypothetical protein [Chthoniobacterales bacterium]